MKATIIFYDGTSRHVKYATGLTMRQILLGEKRPKSKAQEQYLMQVRDVVFDQLQLVPLPVEPERPRNNRMNAILDSGNLSGQEKARAVLREIRRRRLNRERRHSNV